MGLFSVGKKNKKESSVIENKTVKSDQIIFEKLHSDEDKYLTGLADQMMKGNPLILSFETLDIDQANKVIAFLSGVIYAIEGEIVNVKERVFMFATKDVYEDGSIQEIEVIKNGELYLESDVKNIFKKLDYWNSEVVNGVEIKKKLTQPIIIDLN